MTLIFYGPFQKMAEREAVIELTESVSLQGLLHILAVHYPALRPYAAYDTDEALGAHVVFLTNGRVLKLSDPVNNNDRVNVLLPMVGG
jgi:sulfur carrier protein ThiS